jgi:hypothetical protein
MQHSNQASEPRSPWNKGKLIGQKKPLRLKEIWAIRIRLQLANNIRGLTWFNLAIDSKMRTCDLVKLKVRDLTHGQEVTSRAIILQQKTRQPDNYFRVNSPNQKALVVGGIELDIWCCF